MSGKRKYPQILGFPEQAGGYPEHTSPCRIFLDRNVCVLCVDLATEGLAIIWPRLIDPNCFPVCVLKLCWLLCPSCAVLPPPPPHTLTHSHHTGGEQSAGARGHCADS